MNKIRKILKQISIYGGRLCAVLLITILTVSVLTSCTNKTNRSDAHLNAEMDHNSADISPTADVTATPEAQTTVEPTKTTEPTVTESVEAEPTTIEQATTDLTNETAKEEINTYFSAFDETLYTLSGYRILESILEDVNTQIDNSTAVGELSGILDAGKQRMDSVEVSTVTKSVTMDQFEGRLAEIKSTLADKDIEEEEIIAMLILFNIDTLQDDVFSKYYNPDTTYNNYGIGIEKLRIRYRTVMRQTKPENLPLLFEMAQFILNENDQLAVKNMDRILMECTDGYADTISKNIKDFIAYYAWSESSFEIEQYKLSDGGNLALLSIGYPFVNSFLSGMITEEESMAFYSDVKAYTFENKFLKNRADSIN